LNGLMIASTFFTLVLAPARYETLARLKALHRTCQSRAAGATVKKG
jgi:hypothetical protein